MAVSITRAGTPVLVDTKDTMFRHLGRTQMPADFTVRMTSRPSPFSVSFEGVVTPSILLA